MKKIIEKRIVIINAFIFGIGIIFGIIFFILTTNLDKLIVKSEITEFITNIQNTTPKFNNFINSLKYNVIYITGITLSGIIYVLSPLIIFINFYKGMLLGFLITSTIYTYKIKGILYGILLIIPHDIIISLFLIIYSSVILKFSYKLAKGTCKGENINLKLFIKKIGIIYIFGIIISILCSLLEIYFNPILIKILI